LCINISAKYLQVTWDNFLKITLLFVLCLLMEFRVYDKYVIICQLQVYPMYSDFGLDQMFSTVFSVTIEYRQTLSQVSRRTHYEIIMCLSSHWPKIRERSRSTSGEPPPMGKQLVNFITCGCESSASFFVIYTAPQF
jgi:hypothetical protein